MFAKVVPEKHTLTQKFLSGLMIHRHVNLSARMGKLLKQYENTLVGRKFPNMPLMPYPIHILMNM